MAGGPDFFGTCYRLFAAHPRAAVLAALARAVPVADGITF
jgi:hypothetical protein